MFGAAARCAFMMARCFLTRFTSAVEDILHVLNNAISVLCEDAVSAPAEVDELLLADTLGVGQQRQLDKARCSKLSDNGVERLIFDKEGSLKKFMG
jgi:hypothetical protein